MKNMRALRNIIVVGGMLMCAYSLGKLEVEPINGEIPYFNTAQLLGFIILVLATIAYLFIEGYSCFNAGVRKGAEMVHQHVVDTIDSLKEKEKTKNN